MHDIYDENVRKECKIHGGDNHIYRTIRLTWSPMSEMTLLVGSMLLVAKGELMRCYVLENNEANEEHNATKLRASTLSDVRS